MIQESTVSFPALPGNLQSHCQSLHRARCSKIGVIFTASDTYNVVCAPTWAEVLRPEAIVPWATQNQLARKPTREFVGGFGFFFRGIFGARRWATAAAFRDDWNGSWNGCLQLRCLVKLCLHTLIPQVLLAFWFAGWEAGGSGAGGGGGAGSG
jgi:hypothetical protein